MFSIIYFCLKAKDLIISTSSHMYYFINYVYVLRAIDCTTYFPSYTDFCSGLMITVNMLKGFVTFT